MENKNIQLIEHAYQKTKSLIEKYESRVCMILLEDEQELCTTSEEEINFAQHFRRVQEYSAMRQNHLTHCREAWSKIVVQTQRTLDQALEEFKKQLVNRLEMLKTNVDDSHKLVEHAKFIVDLNELIEQCGFAQENYQDGYETSTLYYHNENIDELPGLEETLSALNKILMDWDITVRNLGSMAKDDTRLASQFEAECLKFFGEQ